tara:strand:- start:321 stop:527 length:207 start_codon:yes stop_codon:yes gene_type:complete
MKAKNLEHLVCFVAKRPESSFDPPIFWFEPQSENFCHTKAPFIQTSNTENHDTHPTYNPKNSDNYPVK